MESCDHRSPITSITSDVIEIMPALEDRGLGNCRTNDHSNEILCIETSAVPEAIVHDKLYDLACQENQHQYCECSQTVKELMLRTSLESNSHRHPPWSDITFVLDKFDKTVLWGHKTVLHFRKLWYHLHFLDIPASGDGQVRQGPAGGATGVFHVRLQQNDILQLGLWDTALNQPRDAPADLFLGVRASWRGSGNMMPGSWSSGPQVKGPPSICLHNQP